MNTSRRDFLKQSALGVLQFGILSQDWTARTSGQLPRSSPEKQGFSSASVSNFVNAVNERNLHSLMILKNGNVIAEGWWAPYRPELKHTLYSLSKSFTSTAIGLAAEEGKLSLNDKVVSFFPNKVPAQPGSHLSEMRIKDLLTMSTGHEKDTTSQLRGKEYTDWAHAFLAQPVTRQPGTHFVYNSGATYMLSAILKEVTGENLTEFLKPRLFAPLEITDYDWEIDPQGIEVGGWGLRVTTESIAKFGQLYLQEGKWKGKTVLPAHWVKEATSAHIIQPGKEEDRPKSDWLQGYGYQFWRCRNNCYRGDGAYGQYCVVMPEQQMVIAITSETTNMQAILDEAWTHLLSPSPGKFSESQLKKQLNSLTLPTPSGASSSTLVSQIHGSRYSLENNPLNVSELGLQISASQGSMLLKDNQGSYRIPFGINQWKHGKTGYDIGWLKLINTPIGKSVELETASTAHWKDDQTLEITTRFIDTAHYMRLTLTFNEKTAKVDFRKSTSLMGGDETPYLTVSATKAG